MKVSGELNLIIAETKNAVRGGFEPATYRSATERDSHADGDDPATDMRRVAFYKRFKTLGRELVLAKLRITQNLCLFTQA